MSDQIRGDGFVMHEESASKSSIDFSTFVLGLGSTALIHLGATPHPEGGEPNLVLAQQTIELIALLRTKTQGNLTEAETRLFETLLSDLRLRYVQAAKK